MRLAALLISCAVPATAQDFSLAMPVDCTLGDTCYLQNYVDHDPTEAATDFQCGDLTYDTHKGTDFGLPSLAAMKAGVDVLAAASGVVRGVRNDMRDVIYTADLAEEIAGRDCGNGLVIAHEGGWETQYCHLKEGSVQVTVGQLVEAGDTLGEIGLSGRTQFPHLHLSVRRNGQVIDPFDPEGQITCDAPSATTLWDTPLNTPQGGLLSAGFAPNVPDYEAVKAGTAATLTLTSRDPIVLWTFGFGAQPGDTLAFSITNDAGELFSSDVELTRTQALFMRAGGRRAPDQGWPAGQYDGRIDHLRDGTLLNSQTTSVTLR